MSVRRKQTTQPSERLFADPQRDMFEKSYEEKLIRLTTVERKFLKKERETA